MCADTATPPGLQAVELDARDSEAAMLEHFNECVFAPTEPAKLELAPAPELEEPSRWARVMGRVGRACS